MREAECVTETELSEVSVREKMGEGRVYLYIYSIGGEGPHLAARAAEVDGADAAGEGEGGEGVAGVGREGGERHDHEHLRARARMSYCALLCSDSRLLLCSNGRLPR